MEDILIIVDGVSPFLHRGGVYGEGDYSDFSAFHCDVSGSAWCGGFRVVLL